MPLEKSPDPHTCALSATPSVQVDHAPAVPLQDLLVQATDALRAGCPEAAIDPLAKAAAIRPEAVVLWHDLGLACLEAGRLAEARAALQSAVNVEPRHDDSWFRLGIAQEKLGDLRAAITAYDRATVLNPSLSEAWLRVGGLVYLLGRRDEAFGCFRRAAATGQKSAHGRLGKARALLIENRDDEAERVLRKAIAVDPGNALALDLLGGLLSELGLFDEARSCFERALEIAPVLAGSYYELVRCRPITPADAGLVRRMESALDRPGLEVGQRHRVHLALGKAADDLGDPAHAMQHFDAADRIRQTLAPFDAARFDAEVDRIIARCSPERLALASALGRPEVRPILIVGMPRSGTTLVEQILSSHPDVAAAGELNFWNARGAHWHAQGAASPDERAFLAALGADYLRVLHEVHPRKLRVTDKMPFNFLWAGLIHQVFPQAVIFHCRRSAVDTALSIHQTHFHPGLAFPTGGPQLVAYFRSYLRLTEHWQRVLPPAQFISIDYETLTGDPEPVIRGMVAACGLPWNAACLAPERNPRAIRTASKWQTRQPISQNSVARWRRYAPWLGPLAALLEPDVQVDLLHAAPAQS